MKEWGGEKRQARYIGVDGVFGDEILVLGIPHMAGSLVNGGM